MKKFTNHLALVMVALAVFTGSAVKAQTTPATSTDPNPWRLGFGAESSTSVGSLHTGSRFQLGGSARLQYDITSNFALTLTTGYTSFFFKDGTSLTGGAAPNLGIIPAKFGLKWFFVHHIYLGAEGGAGFEITGNKDTKLILSPTLGWSNNHWDLGVDYTHYGGQNFNFSTAGVRLAYGFGL